MHDDHDRGLDFDLPAPDQPPPGARRDARRPRLGRGRRVRRLRRAETGGATATGGDSIPEETAGPVPRRRLQRARTSSPRAASSARTSPRASGTRPASPRASRRRSTLTLLDVAGGGGPLAGAAVYLWHCDREGRTRSTTESIAGENYLRGVQESDADGKVTFKTIFPAAYHGPLAAHPLRGLREPRRRDLRRARSCAPHSSRSRRTCARPSTPPPATSRACRTSPRPRWTPTWSSATATRASSPTVTGASRHGLHADAERRRLRPSGRGGRRLLPGPVVQLRAQAGVARLDPEAGAELEPPADPCGCASPARTPSRPGSARTGRAGPR